MVGETDNPMSADYSAYGPGGRTNFEVWRDQAEQNEAEAEQRHRERRAWQNRSQSSSDASPLSEGPRFKVACFWLVVGLVVMAWASKQSEDTRQIVGVIGLTAIALSAISIVLLALKAVVRQLASTLGPAIGIGIVIGIIYALMQSGK